MCASTKHLCAVFNRLSKVFTLFILGCCSQVYCTDQTSQSKIQEPIEMDLYNNGQDTKYESIDSIQERSIDEDIERNLSVQHDQNVLTDQNTVTENAPSDNSYNSAIGNEMADTNSIESFSITLSNTSSSLSESSDDETDDIPQLVTNKDDVIEIQPWFKSIQSDLLQLVKQSYLATKRGDVATAYLYPQLLRNSIMAKFQDTGHKYFRDRNFTGVHGLIEKSSCFRTLLGCCVGMLSGNMFKGELDFPGFVSLIYPTTECPYYVIVVTLRGSQSEDFQPLGGKLGASWISNFDALPTDVTQSQYGFQGQMHAGYVTKIKYAESSQESLSELIEGETITNTATFTQMQQLAYPMSQSINNVLSKIQPKDLHKVRFVVTGHSQGGGLTIVALPYIIEQFKYHLPGFINNQVTPRFFGYALSAPRVIFDEDTAESYNNFVGKNNLICHSACRDAVTLAALTNFQRVGTLALDSIYDILYRGVAGEIAHNNRLILVGMLQKSLNYDMFDTSDQNEWKLKNYQNLSIYWQEIIRIITYRSNNLKEISNESLCNLFNQAIKLKSARTLSEPTDLFTPEIMSQIFRKEPKWERLNAICAGKLSMKDIKLDEERMQVLKRIESNAMGETVSDSASGQFNVLALIDTVLDLTEATGMHSRVGGNCGEILRRVFCCSCCWDQEDDTLVSQPYFFDPVLQGLIENAGFNPGKYHISPAGALSLFEYLHYATDASGFMGKYFDKNMPSRDLNTAIHNGNLFLADESQALVSIEPQPEAN